MHADKVGYLFGLSWVMETPVRAVVFTLLISFGLVVGLRAIQGELIGPYYMTLLFGDTFGLTMLLAAYSASFRYLPDDWTETNWGLTSKWVVHLFLLAASYGVSVGLEVSAVKSGTFTIKDEMKPSKAAHTLVTLPILLYLIIAGIPAFIYAAIDGGVGWAIILLGLSGAAVWIFTMWIDGKYPPSNPSRAI